MNMSMGTRRIFIPRVGYEGATTRTLLAPLTFLITTIYILLSLEDIWFCNLNK